jgi:hypothetical protein
MPTTKRKLGLNSELSRHGPIHAVPGPEAVGGSPV